MQRRAFVRSSLATAFLTPAALSLPELAAAASVPRRTRAQQAGAIRLSSNENPLGVPESARQAIIDAIAEGHRYPRIAAFLARIAEANGVDTGTIVLGNGSAEILQMTVQALASRGGGVRVVIADPTFEQVERYAEVMGAEVVKVPLRPDHTHDLERMHDAASSARGPVLVFICNPNNPTGTLTSCDDVARWLRTAPADHWFLIDEAYFEFANDSAFRTFVPDAIARPNTLVSRTFSKIYALAGVRLGYGVAHPDTMQAVLRFAAGTNLNHLALAAGIACLADHAFVRRSLDVNARGLAFASATLKELGVEYLPSHANFIMHRIRGDHARYAARMREEGINVGRQFPPMLDWNRVSIGLPDEMDAWARSIRKLRGEGLV
jgi:histidinol-phosphate aminotransferase